MYALISPLLAIALSSRAYADCFFPNGDVVDSDTACNPNALVSACCFDGQACLSNGLCVSDPHNETLARFHRGTCTDKQWKSGNCPRHCTSIDNNGVPVYGCNQTNVDSYCCFDNCKCNNNFETFSFSDNDVYTLTIIGEDFTNTHTSTASSSSASSASSAATEAITTSGTTSTPGTASTSLTSATAGSSETAAALTATQSKDSNSANTTAIGVGVGVGIAGAALIGVAAFFFWRRKRNDDKLNTYGRQKGVVEMASNEYSPAAVPQKYAYHANESNAPPHSAAPTELPSNNTYDPVELPASPTRPRDVKHIPGIN